MITLAQRFRVLKRDNFRCRYCGKSAPEALLEIDHIRPLSNGGTDDDSNLGASCVECNRGKHANPLVGLRHKRTIARDAHEVSSYEKYSNALSIRFHESTVTLIKARADMEGMRPSDWIRRLVIAELEPANDAAEWKEEERLARGEKR